jgi:hypothetical protein
MKKSILFVVHSYIDMSFLLPMIQILSKNNNITLEFLENFSIHKVDKITQNMLRDSNNIVFINNTKLFFYINYLVKKVFGKNLSVLNDIFIRLYSKKYKIFDSIITDFTLGSNGSPFLKREILSFVKIKHGFVHSIAVSSSLKIKKYNLSRVRLLANNFTHIYYSDNTWMNFLKISGVKQTKFFPSIKFSKFYNDKLIDSITKYSNVSSIKRNENYKDIVLYIDTRITGNEGKTKEISNQFMLLIKNNVDTLFILKVKPRQYTGIVNFIHEKFQNLLIVNDEYSVDELAYISDLIIGRISSTLLLGVFHSKKVLLFGKYRYSGTELMETIDDSSLIDVYYKKLNMVTEENCQFFIDKNKLNQEESFYIGALNEIIMES